MIITLNGSKAAVDLVAMLPLELRLIERNGVAKGMELPKPLSSGETTTRDYEIGEPVGPCRIRGRSAGA